MQNRIKTLISNYLDEELEDNERVELSRLLQTEQGRQILAEIMDQETQALLLADLSVAPATTAKIWSRLEEQIDETPKTNWRIWAWAATLVLAAGLGALFWILQPAGEKHYYATGSGQKRTIILPDGSLITLNSDSKISFAQNRNTRNITLSGEAFFNVKHDPRKPFLVATQGIQIKVLGTSFNVKAYLTDKSVSTTLIEGKVHLETDAGKGLNMTPNQQVNFRKRDQTLVPGDITTYHAENWRNGTLVFENEPLKNILPELEKWYGVKFAVPADNLECRFSMSIGNESLDQLLKIFELSEGIKFNRSPDGPISLGGNLCK